MVKDTEASGPRQRAWHGGLLLMAFGLMGTANACGGRTVWVEEDPSAGEAGDAGRGNGASGEGGRGSTPPSVLLTSVRAYQAVEIPLMADSVAVAERNAPVLAGRDLMLRAFVTPADATPREVVGKLSLVTPGATEVLEARLTMSGPSTADSLASTIVFQLARERVTPEVEWSLSLEETDGAPIARYPEQGSEPLGATDAAGVLEVTLVPLVANGFTPDLSPAALEKYLKYMRAMFPVPDVHATVRDAVTLNFRVDSDGTGLSEALDRLYEVRESDDPADNVYYYGLLTPAATFEEYCASGCTVGLASVAHPNEVYYRGGIGTGYFENPRDTTSQETLVHELGHSMGRQHSPCGTGDNSYFPYANGSIGVWGYDGLTLRSPNRFGDVMGYCLPVWISDYTYAELFERIAHVNATASARRFGSEDKKRYRRLIVGHDGALRWGSETAIAELGSAGSIELEFDAATRSGSRSVRVPFSPFDHLAGGFALVPAELLAKGVRVSFGDASVAAP